MEPTSTRFTTTEVFTGPESARLFADFCAGASRELRATEVEVTGNAVTLRTNDPLVVRIFHLRACAFRFAADNAMDLVKEIQ